MARPCSLASLLGIAALGVDALPSQALSWRRLPATSSGWCAMVFDEARGRFVTVAGRSNYSDDVPGVTLEWSGHAWLPRATKHAPVPRHGFGLVYDRARQRTLLFGGSTDTALLSDLWEYDGSDWRQLTPPGGPQPRTGAAMAYDSVRQRVVLFGGRGFSGELDDTWEWDGVTWSAKWITGPSRRSGAAMAMHAGSRQLVLFGGQLSTGQSNETWTYDGVWTRGSPTTVPAARAGHRMCYDPASDRAFLFGGGDPRLWEWDGANWSPGPGGPPTRWTFGMAASAGFLMVFGGNRTLSPITPFVSPVHDSGDTWSYLPFGQLWVPLQSEVPPHALMTAAAYDAARDRIVLVASLNQPGMQTWEWDGISWSKRTDVPRRIVMGFAVCHDSARGVTMLFGGLSEQFPLPPVDDLYEWNGFTWSQRPRTGAWPSARAGAALAFDSQRSSVVLFGGATGGVHGTGKTAETWRWDGAQWSLVATAGPSARLDHAMAYDSTRDRIVLFGGVDASGECNDTWEWDGLAWAPRAPTVSPAPRRGHAMTYDPQRGRTILIGGDTQIGGSRSLSETWEWDGAVWTATDVGVADANPMKSSVVYHQRHQRSYQWSRGKLWLGSTAPASARRVGTGCGGSRVPGLAPISDPIFGSRDFALELVNASPGKPFVFGMGLGVVTVPIGACTLHVSPLLLFAGTSGPTGHSLLPLPVPPDPQLVGVDIAMQAAVLDGSVPLGLVLTGAVVARVGE